MKRRKSFVITNKYKWVVNFYSQACRFSKSLLYEHRLRILTLLRILMDSSIDNYRRLGILVKITFYWTIFHFENLRYL